MREGGNSAEDGRDWFGAVPRAISALDPDDAAAELSEFAEGLDPDETPRLTAQIAGDTGLGAFLAAAFDLSPFLRDCARRRPQALEMLFDTPLPARLDALNDAIRQAAFSEDTTESAVMAMLRRNLPTSAGAWSSAASRLRTCVIPRCMFTPWSASPMAASSSVRYASCSSILAA